MQRGVGATGFTPGVIPTVSRRGTNAEEIKQRNMSTEEYSSFVSKLAWTVPMPVKDYLGQCHVDSYSDNP